MPWWTPALPPLSLSERALPTQNDRLDDTVWAGGGGEEEEEEEEGEEEGGGGDDAVAALWPSGQDLPSKGGGGEG